MPKTSQTFLLRLIILFLAYFLTAYFGLKLDPVGGFATLVWAPTGIAIAGLLIWERRLWPAIFAAAFAVNFIFHAPPLVSAGIATGNSLEALFAVYVLDKLNFEHSLQRLEDVLLLIIGGSVIATVVSATIGTSSLLLGGVITAAKIGPTWFSWWIGDMLGCLVVTSLILTWVKNPLRPIVDKEKINELLAWVLLMTLITFLVFNNLFLSKTPNGSVVQLLFPLFVWSSLRFSLRVNITAIFVLTAFAIWATFQRIGPFQSTRLSDSLLLLQLFMGVLTTTTLVFVAVVAEQRRFKKELLKLNENLNAKVAEEKRMNKVILGQLKKFNRPKTTISRSETPVKVN